MVIQQSALSGPLPEKQPQPLIQTKVPLQATSPLTEASLPFVESEPGDSRSELFAVVALLSRKQVSERMERDGFPELALIWRSVLKSAPRESSRSVEEVVESIGKHTSPLFGRPALAFSGLAVGATLASNAYLSMSGLATGLSSSPLLLWLAGNLTMLSSLSLCGVQRYVSAPLMKTMSGALEQMLRSSDFRALVEQSPRFASFREHRVRTGLTSSWDNPEYRRHYRRSDRAWQSYDPPSFEQQIHGLLQDFLGSKDVQTNKFSPGKNTPHLVEQKKSVTRFVSGHQAELIKSRKGELEIDAGIDLLKALLESEVRSESEGARILSHEIDRLERRVNQKFNAIVAEVWQRDPWVDLTHQEEFYSSASLRGVKKMGRDSKGRLGTFSYLYNPAISMLDFSTDQGRVVRARCGLAEAVLADGRKVTAVFVDGVEGSNVIPPPVILKGLKDYASACNADALCINAFPLNAVPQRFSRYAAAQGGKLRSVPLEFLDATSREYLDAFGIPVQPFEYAQPKGRVLSYVIDLKGAVADQLSPPSITEQLSTSLRSKFAWGYFGQAIAGAAYLIGSAAPLALVPLGAMAIAGASYQLMFQRRSLKVEGE